MTDDPWITFFVVLTVGANVATLALWALALAAQAGRGRDLWDQIRDSLGESGLAIAAFVAATATVGSLYLSEGANLLPCKLCWYQRIGMYSLAIILVVAVVRRDWSVRPYALVLALAGPVVSIYHYAIERFPDLEVGGSCEAFNPCTLVPVWRLHYISIPFMALSAFALIVTVLVIARPEASTQQEVSA